MKRMRPNSNSRACLLVTIFATAALVTSCGGETAPSESSGAMEDMTAERAAAADPMDADAETTPEISGETRMDGPPTSATTETMPEGSAQESGEQTASSESMPSDEAATDEPGMAGGEPLPGSGVPVWEEGAVGKLVAGLDGGEYDAYAPEVIGQVQEALFAEGIYTGPINRVLDEPTMNAIGQYQEANDIQVSGVPSPMTRAMLLENNG